MQVTSLLSRQEHEESCAACDHDHEHAPVELWQTLVGVVFVINAFLVDWLFQQAHAVASGRAVLGAITLGYPILWPGVKDIDRGLLSIADCVSIAGLAASASGDCH